jgi:hypothetical protein
MEGVGRTPAAGGWVMKPQQPERFVLVLRPEPGNWAAPPFQRLRLALKCLLRAYGLRCTDCRVQEAGASTLGHDDQDRGEQVKDSSRLAEVKPGTP